MSADAESRISVVIPTLDEESCIGARLVELRRMAGLREVIIVDGRSQDRTVDIAQSSGWARVLDAPRGRAAQMNAGARLATGNILLFLHADVSLPPGAAGLIVETLADHDVVGGAFRTWTITGGRRGWLSPLLHLADLRSRYSRLPYGDQATFVRADAFWRIGGFPEQPLMEDFEFSRRLRRLGRVRTVPAVVRVSGRRFLARPLYYAFLTNIFPMLYRLGVPPARLAKLYGNPR